MRAGTMPSSAKRANRGSALGISSWVVVWMEGMTGIVGPVVFRLHFLHWPELRAFARGALSAAGRVTCPGCTLVDK